MRTKKFTKILIAFVLMTAIVAAGCNKSGNVVGPDTKQVSFQISQQPGEYGGTQFLFTPAIDVKISRVISMYQPQQFADTINYTNVNYVYTKGTTYIINEYNGVQNGQQWKFNFSGSIPNQTNSNYNVTMNYTAQ